MHDSMHAKDTRPWYRYGWPWFLIAIPAIAVTASIFTLWLAASTWDGLVVDDYYQEGKTIERTIERALRASEMGLAADVNIRAEDVTIRLTANEGVPIPQAIVLTIVHPTRTGHDQSVVLGLEDGVFAGPVGALSTGRWLIQLEDESRTWRLNGSTYLPAETEIRMLPDVS